MHEHEIINRLMWDHSYTRYEAERLVRDRDADDRAMNRHDDPEEVAGALARADTTLHA